MVKRAIVLVAGMAALSTAWAVPALAQGGNQTFTIHLAGSKNGTVTASGPISGTGQANSVNEFTERLIFKGTGSVTFTRQATDHSESFDPVKCLSHIHESGRYQISHGTKKYAGASGSGTYSLQGTSRGKKTAGPAGCSGPGGPLSGTITAHGTTHLRHR